MMVEITPIKVILAVSILVVASVSVYFWMNSDDEEADITIAWASKDCFEPFWVADAKGYWAEAGVRVKHVSVPGGGMGAQMVLSGNADLAGVGDVPTLRAMYDDPGIDILCRYQMIMTHELVAIDGRNGGKLDMTEYQKAYDIGPDALKGFLKYALEGANIGLDTSTAYYAWFLGLLEIIDLDRNDVTIRHIPLPQQVAALSHSSDPLDAIFGGSPNTENALALPNAFMIVHPDPLPAPIFLIAGADAMKNKSDAIVKVMRALQMAVDFIYDHPEEAAQIVVDAFGPPWTAERQLVVFDRSIWGISPFLEADFTALENAIHAMDPTEDRELLTLLGQLEGRTGEHLIKSASLSLHKDFIDKMVAAGLMEAPG
jgi:NitT/TauT family transport system substrate-binding protein